jgi:histidyl-tRNA synthetase
MKVEKCTGMRDILPADVARYRRIEEVFRDSCRKWGYEEVRTPTLEYLHLFTAAGLLTPGMLGKVYSFLDWDGWSGERVVLRPEATIPVARLFSENLAEKELAKLFYIVNTFIYEEPGRNREKWQAGAELIGMRSPLADVELIVLAIEVLRRLGIAKVDLKLSHAGLTRGILQKLDTAPEQQDRIFDRLLDGDATVLNQIQVEKPALAPLLALQGKTAGFIKNLAATLAMDLPEFKAQTDDFIFIAGTLKALGYDFSIDIASVRGFEYYTGMIFQLFVDGERVGGGGRYDALIPAMGKPQTPASGFALYSDLLAPRLRLETEKLAATILVQMDEKSYAQGFAAAGELRARGLVVKLHLGGQGPTGIAWKLAVNECPPEFVLTEAVTGQQWELRSIQAVLAKLTGQSAGNVR